ncbi:MULTISPECIES: glycosyltransferase family 4 protein [unclassified Mesorhizobium]|uniref:glycosyltransferase family 4 protein n=1 Tax=unclassified Mesorhizobium TaxID=325217 RepID=UPI00112EB002|nr:MULTISPECIES: glycosyltransferase family 4 protein [unclassified Mesorhizobium]TPN50149.1 glycosyltransferase family 4 protein [Mesorhizobium sp. B1-1-9]TPN53301.1 glycosyltransferase family 4 protein [Mesorhizobium sp. B1-1-7]
MKVVILSQPFDTVTPPAQNSIGIWTYEVARRLGGDCETTVLARRLRGMPAQLEIDRVRFELLRCAPARIWGLASRVWRHVRPRSPLVAQGIYAVDYLAQALRAIRRVSPDVIHVQNFPQYVPAIRRAAPKAAIMLHMHCDWLAELDREAMRRALAATDLVVGCSGHVLAGARKRFAELDKAFAVLPNGAPVSHTVSTTARIPGRVLFVGRVSPEKGLHTLMEAWQIVSAELPMARLEVVGPSATLPREFLIDLSSDYDVRDLARFYKGGREYLGSYEAALRAMLPASIASTVSFLGTLPYGLLTQRYVEASLLVNPSLSESFGMSLIEALSAGTPVLATRVGGMTEIVEGIGGGVLVEKNDPQALAAQIIDLLANPARAAMMGSQAAARVADRYGWEKIAESTLAQYATAISARRARF